MRNYDLMYGWLGNGVTVFDLSREEHGDYKTVAHIDPCGAVMFYETVPPEIQSRIFGHAAPIAEQFKAAFLRQRKEKALDELNSRLNISQYLLTFQEDRICEKGMDEIYLAYIRAVCCGGRRVMPDQLISRSALATP